MLREVEVLSGKERNEGQLKKTEYLRVNERRSQQSRAEGTEEGCASKLEQVEGFRCDV